MPALAERKKHIIVDTIWDEAFDSSLEYQSEGRTQFIVDLSSQYIQTSDATKIILDVGCGSGKYISAMNNKNEHSLFIGLDLDLKGVQIAKRNNASNKRSEFIVASLYNLPFRDQVADVGTMWEVIEHIPPNTETSALRELFRVLKSNANLLLSTPNDHLISVLLDPAYFLRGHRHYSINKIAKIMESCGFLIVEKFVKGGIFSLIAMDMMYVYKHVLKKPMPTKKHRLIRNRANREYLKNSKEGLSNVFIVARSIGKDSF
jgi:ubiquinone/menaquinone biosynthesis C-methylase UbiE